MASISNDPNGRRRILFVGADGKRRTIRLGKVSRRNTEAVKVKVEHLVSAKITGSALDNETAQWINGVNDVLADRLASAGLMPKREVATFGGWVEKYITGRTDLKPASRVKLIQTRDKLLAWFDVDTPLRSITANQAADWRQWLIGHGVSKATVKTHVGNAKTIFNAAVDRELIVRSPFDRLTGGATASNNTRYITQAETDKLLAAAPDLRYRALLGLARLAGLRTPSETHVLTWQDVDWQRARLTVRSAKTEHHVGKAQRIVPIVPALMAILQDAFDAADEGVQRIVTLGRGGNIRRVMLRIIERAGVEPWRDLWQVMRRSREKEWAMRFPQYAVSQWIGHSIQVSGKHYVNGVPDELFDQAAQNAAQHPAASGCTDSQTDHADERESTFCDQEQGYATQCNQTERVSEGIRTPDPRDHNAVL